MTSDFSVSSLTEMLRDSTGFVLELDRNGSEKFRLSHVDFHAVISASAEAMKQAGWSGHNLLIAMPNGLEFAQILAACALANVTAVPCGPARSDAQRERLAHISRDAAVCAIVLHDTALKMAEGLAERAPVLSHSHFLAGDLPRAGASGVMQGRNAVFVQYTSGSTGEPKGVVIDQDTLLANLELMRRTYDLGKRETVMSWLPMFHDFGLVGGIYQGLINRYDLILSDPFSFVQKPLRWLTAMSDYRATMSGGPNFAFRLIADKVALEDLQGLDLSAWRVCVNGAEPISARVTERFCALLGPAGFRPEAMMPSYGMAEVALCISANRSARAVETRRVKAGANMMIESVSLGCPDAELITTRVVNRDTLALVPDGAEGEILIAGPTVFKGYLNPAANTGAFVDLDGTRFFRTGDIGAMIDGELHILGRAKDVIKQNGRSLHPGDIEAIAADVLPSHRPNSVICIGLPGQGDLAERVVLVCEVHARDRAAIGDETLVRAVTDAVARGLSIHVTDILFVYPGALPKTSSGKPRRGACRDMALAGHFDIEQINEGVA